MFKENRLIHKHAYEFVASGGGFSVVNNGTKTEVISQTGVIKGDIQDSLAEGSIYIGNASGVTSEVDFSGDAKIGVGNGTTFASVAVSGDISLANTGAATVASLDLETATVTNVEDTEVMIGTGSGTANFAALSGDITMSNAGVTAIGADKVTNAMMKVPKSVVYQETFAFGDMTDGGATVGTFDLSHSIPAGSVFERATIHALTGFIGDTSAVMTLGDGSDVDRYNTGTPNVFADATPGVDLGVPSGTLWHTAAATPKVTITTAADFTSVSAGQMTVTLFYYRPV
jgi:hypothetical protein